MSQHALVEQINKLDTLIAQTATPATILEQALRISPCPGIPDEMTGDCFDRGDCGCVNGAALRAARGLEQKW